MASKVLQNNTNSSWMKDPGLRRLNLGIGFMLSASATAGYCASMINGLLVLPEFSRFLGGLDTNERGLIIAAVSLGSFCAFIPGSYIADNLGRRICVLIGATLVITASIIQVATKNPWVFFGARVLAGMGVGVSQTAAPLLITESTHPRQRQAFTGLYNALWFIGSITSAAIGFAGLAILGSWSWKLPCLTQVFYPVLQLIGLCFVPESPRWLVSRGRKEEGMAILARYHANGDETDELVQDEFYQICKSINAESDKSCRRWSTFFATRSNIHRLSICVILGFMQEWSGNGVVSYYLAPILESVGIYNASHQAAINISMQVWNLGFAVAGAMAADRYGRRKLWLIATMLMFIYLSAATAMSGLFQEMHVLEAGIAVVPMLFLFCSAYDMAYMPLFIAYPAEILPFQLRAKGLAITLTTDSMACFFNQFINPVALAAIRWKYFTVYLGCLVIFMGTIYFLFPETKGLSLEEVARIFEKEKTYVVETHNPDVSQELLVMQKKSSTSSSS
ncbi:Major facilitator superfamily domain general substrate transporter [Penicillium coprophilum]|uniref:Major facilitator superfamily domain general substrate transporter n=1 Tax=Penicillium coprophilum TaxID=36646 RepID=UPI0023924599|nr:Major facilitator superfamily domain general substrate transporter [Penicillium coprophilum]KAJ5169607.1 Major facilitator superfamily domain general substrate transporter [Penicillium coprophilum]